MGNVPPKKLAIPFPPKVLDFSRVPAHNSLLPLQFLNEWKPKITCKLPLPCDFMAFPLEQPLAWLSRQLSPFSCQVQDQDGSASGRPWGWDVVRIHPELWDSSEGSQRVAATPGSTERLEQGQGTELTRSQPLHHLENLYQPLLGSKKDESLSAFRMRRFDLGTALVCSGTCPAVQLPGKCWSLHCGFVCTAWRRVWINTFLLYQENFN